jgi:ubiquitin-like 1-activating enzyme E1 A
MSSSPRPHIADYQLYSTYPTFFSGLGFLDELSVQSDPNQANAGSANPPTTTQTELHDASLSVEEQRVYDRQIRIWGLETQNLMRQSRVLFIGRLNGLGAEICKNLVLSGIGSLTLCDNVPVTATSFDANFLLRGLQSY